MKAEDLIAEAGERLRASDNIDWSWKGEEREQASELLTHALGHEPDDDEDVPAAVRRRFAGYVERRLEGEPVALITGKIEFRGIEMEVRPGVFIPRATTEFLAEMAIRRLRNRRDAVHLDVACGIGPVALSVASDVPHCDVHATDLSGDAVAVGRHNAKRLGLDNVAFHTGDLYGALPDHLRSTVDVITVHPPYVPKREVQLLPVEIRGFEPVHTLTDNSSDGLGLIHRCVDESWDWLCEGGWLLMECHPSDVRFVKGLMQRSGFGDVRSHRGELKWTRVLAART